MQLNERGRQKRAVEQINFGTKTSKRATWEAWEFTVVGSHQIRITNANYGFLKDDHSYTVGVEERNGVVVPVMCDCPADEYHRDYNCKHKVALATVAGPTVLDASLKFESPPAGTLRTDGGCECDGLGSPVFRLLQQR